MGSVRGRSLLRTSFAVYSAMSNLRSQIQTYSQTVPAAKQSGYHAQQQGSLRSMQAGTPPLSP